MGGLLLFAFAPRALMAYKLDVICNDATLYIQIAAAWESGNWAAVQGMPLNPYPLLLVALHRLGLDWEAAGKLWGVLAATLVVWPMFGFVRRQFDDRLAALACLLYAVHPKLIEKSAELVRDQTFWLLFTLAVYALWRAVAEVRARWFLLFGVTGALAAVTRFEGVLLAVPLACWLVARLMALETGRSRLCLAALASVAWLPLALLAGEVFLLAEHPELRLFNHDPLLRLQQWAASWLELTPGGETVAVSAVLPRGGIFWTWLNILERGLHPLYIVLLVTGYLACRPLWNRRDHLPLGLVNLGVVLGVWIHIWYCHQASTRHVLLIVLTSTRCAAFGLLELSRLARGGFERLGAPAPLVRAAPAALVLVMAAVGWGDALSSDETSARDRAVVGRWIQHQFGSSRLIVCSDNLSSLVGYYAETHCLSVPSRAPGPALIETLERVHPDVVVLSRAKLPADSYRLLLAERERLGLAEIDAARLPVRPQEIVLLVRADRLASVAH